MKSFFKIVCLSIIIILTLHYVFILNEPASKVNSRISDNISINEDVDVTDNELTAFNFLISTTLLTNNKITNQSRFKGYILLKPTNFQYEQQGQIVNATIDTLVRGNLKKIVLPNNLAFKINYDTYAFSNINFLNLDPEHPANAIEFLLQQLSYNLDKPLNLTSATNTARYSYNKIENKIVRQAISKQYFDNNLNLKNYNETEDWYLQLSDNNKVMKMVFDSENLYKSDVNHLKLKQEIIVTLNDSSFDFKTQNYEDDANSSIENINLITKQKYNIHNESDLLKAISQLDHNMQNEVLLSEIGRYLSKHYSTDKLLNFINASDQSSALIYALQKSNTIESEISLIELLEHPDLHPDNQQRVIMSLARVNNASDFTFTSLKGIANNKEHQYSNTALLNIGSVAKFSPDLSVEVESYLEEQLKQPNNTAITLLAINNSGSKKFNKQVSSLLGHGNSDVNIGALKILSKDPKYQDLLINYVSTTHNPKEIETLIQSLKSKGRILTANQKEIIGKKLAVTEHPILKTKLSNLLSISSKSQF